jgi:hypothetical protein
MHQASPEDQTLLQHLRVWMSEDMHAIHSPFCSICVAFMRLCVYGWGLFSATSCRVVPPLVRGAARLALPDLSRNAAHTAKAM